jgi:hypothetical protein
MTRTLLMSKLRLAQRHIAHIDIVTIASLMTNDQLQAHVDYYWSKAGLNNEKR